MSKATPLFSTQLPPVAIADPEFEYAGPRTILIRQTTTDGEFVCTAAPIQFMRSLNLAMKFIDENLGPMLADTVG